MLISSITVFPVSFYLKKSVKIRIIIQYTCIYKQAQYCYLSILPLLNDSHKHFIYIFKDSVIDSKELSESVKGRISMFLWNK